MQPPWYLAELFQCRSHLKIKEDAAPVRGTNTNAFMRLTYEFIAPWRRTWQMVATLRRLPPCKEASITSHFNTFVLETLLLLNFRAYLAVKLDDAGDRLDEGLSQRISVGTLVRDQQDVSGRDLLTKTGCSPNVQGGAKRTEYPGRYFLKGRLAQIDDWNEFCERSLPSEEVDAAVRNNDSLIFFIHYF
jgi:hypothetical protein